MNPLQTHRPLVLLTLVAGLFLVSYLGYTWLEQRTLTTQQEALQAQLLGSKTEAAAESVAEQLRQLDTVGIPGLVAGMRSDVLEVEQISIAALRQTFTQWQTLSTAEASSRQTILAQELASNYPAMSRSAAREAKRFAELILLSPVENPTANSQTLIANCAAVLRMPLPAESPRKTLLARREQPAEVPPVPASVDTSLDDPVEIAIGPASVAPPAPLAVKPPSRTSPKTIPTLGPQRLEESQDQAAVKVEPRRFLAPKGTPLEESTEPLRLPSDNTQTDGPAGDEPQEEVSDLELMYDLHAADKATEARAVRQLVERGYQPDHLALARRLTDPDPKVRKKLAESLPRIRGLNARPWLLALSEDASEEVRTAARNILKTGQDPELLRKLR